MIGWDFFCPISERGYPVDEVSARLGVSQHGLYQWLKLYTLPEEQRAVVDSQSDEIRRLKAGQQCETEERNILKQAAAYFANESRYGTPLSVPAKSRIRFDLCAG